MFLQNGSDGVRNHSDSGSNGISENQPDGQLVRDILLEFEPLRKKHPHDNYYSEGRAVLAGKILERMKGNDPISFVLPSFPFKSRNPDNVLGERADFGDEVALATL